MIKKSSLASTVSLTLGLVLAVALAARWSATAVADDKHAAHDHHGLQMTHIKTQAEAEALKPGDSIAMVCSMCKHVMVHTVGKDKSHVKMITVGHKHTCADCGGTVTVVGVGKGEGKHEEVSFVCSKCGDDAMFACATKPGGSGKHQHEHKD